jgi:hypothetical protein
VGLFNSLFERDIGKVTTSYSSRGNSRDEKIYINLDISNYESGRYELVVHVEDLTSNEKASKEVSLVIIR